MGQYQHGFPLFSPFFSFVLDFLLERHYREEGKELGNRYPLKRMKITRGRTKGGGGGRRN